MLRTSIPWWLKLEMGAERLLVEEGFSGWPLLHMRRGIPAEVIAEREPQIGVEAESNDKPKRTRKAREPAVVARTERGA